MKLNTAKRLSLLAAAIALGLTFVLRPSSELAAQPSTGTPAAPAVVEVAAARSSLMAPLQWVPGTVASRHDARVASSESGRVTHVAEVGTQVNRGAVLARIDDEALRLALRQLEAALQQSESRRAFAERQAERMESVTARSSLAEAQLDQIRAERDERQQQSAQARAAVADAKRRLREATIRAPFAGTVVERFVEVGEHLAIGAGVVRLVDTVDLEISARAPVSLGPALQSVATVQVRDARGTQDAELRTLVPVGDIQSRQLEVRISVPDAAFLVGAAVEVALPSSLQREVISVPRDALVLRTEGSYVFRIDAEGKAERLSVTTGRADGDLVEVSGSALASGDQLVTRGAERLQDGQSVAINPGS
jgi:RND family efflux transporter MFP subunit